MGGMENRGCEWWSGVVRHEWWQYQWCGGFVGEGSMNRSVGV